MADSYGITVDATSVVAMLGRTAEELKAVMVEQLTTVSELVKEEMRKRASVGVGGDNGLRGSIGFVIVPGLLKSEIKPSAAYGDAVETGSRPHWISAKKGSPLELWAAQKGINVYALQHSIAMKGTKPHPYIKPTYDEVAPLVGVQFARGVSTFINEAQKL